MIVYGDPKYQIDAAAFLDRIRRLASSPDGPTLESIRHILIATGELEQGIADSAEILSGSPELLAKTQNLTDFFARSFCAAYRTGHAMTANHEVVVRLIDQISFPEPFTITIKIPEGFAFYALYPEQYFESARKWASTFPGEKAAKVVVVGIRSIGTTLSAIVAATLETLGWKVHRITVRPGGHPFTRTVSIEPRAVGDAQLALIVDEGPGASGSSVVAVAEALEKIGIAPERIAFLPGHAGSPGNAASEKIKSWWGTTPRFTSSWQELRWNGTPVTDVLLQRSSDLLHEPCVFCDDLSGGLWRKFLCRREEDWPAVTPTFERLKFLCRSRSGRGVLWKFSGLGPSAGEGISFSEEAYQQMRLRSHVSGLKPLGGFAGFIAMPWISGIPLRAVDVNSKIIDFAAHYVMSSSRQSLSAAESTAAVERLLEMVKHNVKEALGHLDLTSLNSLVAKMVGTQFAFGIADGRMAPHEWLKTIDGRLIKTDTTGHDIDHTIIGRQCFLWDVAGFTGEWDLNNSYRRELLDKLGNQGCAVDENVLSFFELAYAAFRMGQTHFCNCMSTNDLSEKQRLLRASNCYQSKLGCYL